MNLFNREPKVAALSVQSGSDAGWAGFGRKAPAGPGERFLYSELRKNVPIIDAAIYKLCRLVGGFTVTAEDQRAQKQLSEFLETVPSGGGCSGIHKFLSTYLEDLLTYGNAVGEMVVSNGELCALYNADLDDLELEDVDPFNVKVSVLEPGGKRECKYPQLLMVSALNPPSGSPFGTSVLRGLSFVSDVLMKIYKTVGVNWERAGSVRFAVTCKPESGGFSASDRAQQMAREWKKAMRSGEVGDFVAVGDVSVKAIGADGQILDSEVPARQMLEQIVAKLGLPPFLLGLSWSSTERMSSQQADVLTSELEAYRRVLTPVVLKIVNTWLLLNGYLPGCEIHWDEITMQDEVDHANAMYLTAKAGQIEASMKGDE